MNREIENKYYPEAQEITGMVDAKYDWKPGASPEEEIKKLERCWNPLGTYGAVLLVSLALASIAYNVSKEVRDFWRSKKSVPASAIQSEKSR